jgi:multidrug efflux pump subunit AcrA (membrane-fusion protein)
VSRRLAFLLALVALLAIPASALAAPAGSKKAATAVVPDATVKIEVGHLDNGRAEIYGKVPVTGTISPYVPGQKVQVDFFLDGKDLVSHKLAVGKGKNGTGSFRSSVIVREDG